MSIIQKLVMTLLPKSWGSAIKRESEQWVARCPVCSAERSVWEIGGIRYKAASVGKRVLVHCPQCDKTRMMPLVFREPD